MFWLFVQSALWRDVLSQHYSTHSESYLSSFDRAVVPPLRHHTKPFVLFLDHNQPIPLLATFKNLFQLKHFM